MVGREDGGGRYQRSSLALRAGQGGRANNLLSVWRPLSRCDGPRGRGRNAGHVEGVWHLAWEQQLRDRSRVWGQHNEDMLYWRKAGIEAD